MISYLSLLDFLTYDIVNTQHIKHHEIEINCFFFGYWQAYIPTIGLNLYTLCLLLTDAIAVLLTYYLFTIDFLVPPAASHRESN